MSKNTKKIFSSQKQKILVFSILPVLVILGWIGYYGGWIGDDSKQQNTTDSLANPVGLNVANANVAPIEEYEKNGTKLDELDPTSVRNSGTSSQFDGVHNSTSGFGEKSLPTPSGDVLTGKDKKSSPQPNSYNYDQEKAIQKRFDNIERGTSSSLDRQAYGYNTRKPRAKRIDYQGLQQQNSETVNNVYSNPATPEQQLKLESQARKNKVKEQKLKEYDDALLGMLAEEKKRNQEQAQAVDPTNQKQPKRRQEAISSDDPDIQSVNTKSPSYTTEIKGNLINTNQSPQIISKNSENAFFGINGKKISSQQKHSAFEAVEGFIHGNGDGVTVSNGTTIKIRIASETILSIKGEHITIPANTIISGSCSLSGDRIMIKVNSLRIDNLLYPISMSVYDLDGQQGIYVKDLHQKTSINSALVQTASQSLQPSYMIGQGGVGSQVATQLATNTLQQGLNIGRNVLSAKVAVAKAFIRPNYRVLLKFQIQ